MSNQHSSNETASPRQRSAWPLFLILIIVTVPIVGAYVAYYTGLGVAEETVNEGILLQPPVAVENLLGTPLTKGPEDGGEPIWRLLIPIQDGCGDACQQNLYTTRQVHIRLGDDALRVKRIAVNLSGQEGESHLRQIEEEHPLLEEIAVTPEKWRAWLAGTNVPADKAFYLLVDPQGYAMMAYTADHHGNELLDDLKRILRFTPE